MKIPGLRSSYEMVGGIVYFGRVLDKIRLHAAGKLPPGYNLGTRTWTWFDARCTRFLRVNYEALANCDDIQTAFDLHLADESEDEIGIPGRP